VAGAITEALAIVPAAAPPGYEADNPYRLVIALGGEQGFTGRYDDMLLDAAMALAGEAANLLLVGDRALAKATERGLAPWRAMPMVAHAEEVPALADRIADALYDRLTAGRMPRVTLVHARHGRAEEEGGAEERIVEKRLLPFDFARFAGRASPQPPLLNLPPARLLARLNEEYVFAEICEALTLAHAAENEARMRAMIAARANVDQRLEGLTAAARRMRQEAITSEVTELAAASSN
jgi:F-type H+-transporting ATPase subunit gamma